MAEAKRILVVDDEENYRLLLRRVLEQEGYQVTTADNGLAALQAIDASRPDLVICDINMPELDGLEMVEGLRNYSGTEGLPVIFLTASEDPGDLVKSVNLKVRHFMGKPFVREHLLAKVRTLIGA